MIILSGKTVAEEENKKTSEYCNQFFKLAGRKPALAVVLVGHDPASALHHHPSGHGIAPVAVLGEHAPLTPERQSSGARDVAVEDVVAAAAVDDVVVGRAVDPSGDHQLVEDHRRRGQ